MPAQPDGPDATELLHQVADGRQEAESPLLALLYDELRAIARRHMGGHTLQPTALVSEAWMKLTAGRTTRFADREHFLAYASRAMRNVLVDHARGKATDKRGGNRERVPLDAAVADYEARGVDLIELDQALDELAASHPELVALVELRFFGRLLLDEAASVLGVSPSGADRRWKLARIWLRERLGGHGVDDG